MDEIASAVAADAGLDAALLGDTVEVLRAAVAAGRAVTRAELARARGRGRDAARAGVPASALVGLHLSAAGRLWPRLPVTLPDAPPGAAALAGEVVLRAAADLVAALSEGHRRARRDLLRDRASARREFVDDLLSGQTPASDLVHRGPVFGLDLDAAHTVAVLRAGRPVGDASALVPAVAAAAGRGGASARPAFAATKDGAVVVVAGETGDVELAQRLARLLAPPGDGAGGVDLHRHVDAGDWRLGVGRARPGPAGVHASYREALEALDVAARLALPGRAARAADLLAYRALLRDRAALVDLVETVLSPLAGARGGAGPLLDTLAAYFATGTNTALTARRLHLSVRAVGYRLDRVRSLTGHDPDDEAHRFTLHAAVIAAQLLSRPGEHTPAELP